MTGHLTLLAVHVQVNEAQLHGAIASKYSTYRPALTGANNAYATGVSTRLPLR